MPPKFIKKKYDNTITIRNKNAIFLIIMDYKLEKKWMENFNKKNSEK